MLRDKYSIALLWRLAAVIVLSAGFVGSAAAQENGGVRGRVRTLSGSGIPNATVTARKDGVEIKTVTADSKGNFTLDGLEAGRYNLVFDAPRYSSGVLYNIEVKRKKTTGLPDRLFLTIDQGTIIVVRGSVFYREGTSLGGASVKLEQVNADGTTKNLGTTTTGISGEFIFKRPEGQAKLRLTASFKGVEGTREIEVDSAAIYRLAILLDISRTEK